MMLPLALLLLLFLPIARADIFWSTLLWKDKPDDEHYREFDLGKRLLSDLKRRTSYIGGMQINNHPEEEIYTISIEKRIMKFRCEGSWVDCRVDDHPIHDYGGVIQYVMKLVIRGVDARDGNAFQILGDFIDSNGNSVYKIDEVAEDMDFRPGELERWFHAWYTRGAHIRLDFKSSLGRSLGSLFSLAARFVGDNHDLQFTHDNTEWKRRGYLLEGAELEEFDL